jgi:hypothetical protein
LRWVSGVRIHINCDMFMVRRKVRQPPGHQGSHLLFALFLHILIGIGIESRYTVVVKGANYFTFYWPSIGAMWVLETYYYYNHISSSLRVITENDVSGSEWIRIYYSCINLFINVRENRRNNQEWEIQRNWQYWVHRTQYGDKQYISWCTSLLTIELVFQNVMQFLFLFFFCILSPPLVLSSVIIKCVNITNCPQWFHFRYKK